MTRPQQIYAAATIAVVFGLLGCTGQIGDVAASSSTSESLGSQTASNAPNRVSSLRTVSYPINYQGRSYSKTAHIYVPAAYREGTAMDVLYLMHGSGMDHADFASVMQPQFDAWIAVGDMAPMLVVIPTYYPDDSFVVNDYSKDYPLNHFFATAEITTLMPVVESAFTTHALDSTPQGLKDSRSHRAFGGYSMGAITTWDVLVAHPEYFTWFMPMAGDSWIGRTTGRSDVSSVAETLASGLRDHGFTANDFQVIAMVGGSDGTKSAMLPLIEELRESQGDLFTERSLLYWENDGGGHNQQSLEIETHHGMGYLFGTRTA